MTLGLTITARKRLCNPPNGSTPLQVIIFVGHTSSFDMGSHHRVGAAAFDTSVALVPSMWDWCSVITLIACSGAGFKITFFMIYCPGGIVLTPSFKFLVQVAVFLPPPALPLVDFETTLQHHRIQTT